MSGVYREVPSSLCCKRFCGVSAQRKSYPTPTSAANGQKNPRKRFLRVLAHDDSPVLFSATNAKSLAGFKEKL